MSGKAEGSGSNLDHDSHPLPSSAELRLLRVLWVRGPRTVREVHGELGARSYSTTLTLMRRLFAKRLVRRVKVGRSYLYQAKRSEQTVLVALMRRVTEHLFKGGNVAVDVDELARNLTTRDDSGEA